MLSDTDFAFYLRIVPVAVIVRLLLKTSVLSILLRFLQSLEDMFCLHQSYVVPRFGESLQENRLYRKVGTYLNSLASLEDSEFTDLISGTRENDVLLRLNRRQVVRDVFMSARVSWTNEAGEGSEGGAFVLRIRNKDRKRILQPYLQKIFRVSEEIERRRKEVQLFVNLGKESAAVGKGRWGSMPLTHPATMDTVVMDLDQKNMVKADLEQFLKSKQYYHRLGRIWRRSYLLHGPPGTGKSSFVVAMAKFLGYDIYDMDLSRARDDSDLKALLMQTSSRSIILVEDIDRFFLTTAGTSISGLLNFMDGIVSCCGEERIMVLTTCSVLEGVDRAVTRPGRMDVQIHFPLCDPAAVKALAGTYLGVKEHKLFPEVEEAFRMGPSLSPAHVGELLQANRNSPSRALKAVIGAVRQAQAEAWSEGKGTTPGSRWGRPSDEAREPGSMFCRESVHTVREFRKLSGLFRMGRRRRDDSLDLGPSEFTRAHSGSSSPFGGHLPESLFNRNQEGIPGDPVEQNSEICSLCSFPSG
ncbi:hypothetical protein MLD38_033484 [Melastoma candidum]|uniref:Uncharacterized protein n=1 Tax=Melastoma candidum TaxID=119954 RepID=A0ACB9MAM9_9MYRT|nr:hypothetical protein MLD38_033484 [Melastoma candidum]